MIDFDGAVALGRAAAEIARKSSPGVPLRPGLSPTDLDLLESRLGVPLAPDHRSFLSQPLPAGPRWPNWREFPPKSLSWPIEGVLFDVEHNAAWHRDWGERPPSLPAALEVARAELAKAPVLLPLYSHRYLPTGPTAGAPVLSVVQTDVVVYGADLRDWAEHEFTGVETTAVPRIRVPFWTDVVEAAGLPGSLG